MPAHLDLLATGLFDLVQTYIYNAHASVYPDPDSRSIIGTYHRILATVIQLQAWVRAISPQSDSMHPDLTHAVGRSIILMLAACDSWALNVALVAFVATWERLPNTPSSSPVIDDLPSFDRFVKSLHEANARTPPKAITANETPKEAEHPSCIICWSSDDAKQLPCAHLVCIDCLQNLRTND